MHTGMPAQGAGLGAALVTPGKQKQKRGEGSAIDDLVRELRDEWNLAIAPRDLVHSPGLYDNSTGDALYKKIKSLYWDLESREILYKVIKECETDFTGPLSGHSPQRRTDYVLQKLHDPAWFATNRVHKSLLHANAQSSARTPSSLQSGPHWLRRVNSGADTEVRSTPTSPLRPRTPPSLQPGRRSLQRVDSRADTEVPSTPASPLARKSMANAQDTTPTSTWESSPTRTSFPSNSATTNTSLTDSVTHSACDESFGSSWTSSQVEIPRTGLRRTASDSHISRSIPPTAATSSDQRSAKRRRSDEFQDVPETATKKARQEPPRGLETPQSERYLWDKHKVKDRHHQVTALEKSGSVVEFPWMYNESISFAASVEQTRITHHTGVTDERVSSISEQSGAKDLLTSCHTTPFQHSHSAIWRLPKVTCASAEDMKLVLGVSISFNPKNDKNRIFQTSVQAIRKETESTHLERHFGWDRIFTLTAPSCTQGLPEHLKGQGEAITLAFADCIMKPQHLMGRTWRFFYTKEIIKKISGKRIIDNSRVREFSFFAISGDGIETPVSYFDFIDWMIPFKMNLAQTIYKLFARIALYLSRTKPTIQFRYDQIRFVEDLVADGEAEDTTYDDPALIGKSRKKFDQAEVMTDGCARISVGAALQICNELGITERPSTFQARINGHKGIWAISDSYETHKPEHLSFWIELRPSQAKVKFRDQDRDVTLCESDRWSFNVVDYTRPSRNSELHRDFLPVLEDRHVPRRNPLAIIDNGLELDRKSWSDAMDDPARWVIQREEHFRSDSNRRTFGNGLPHTAADKSELLMDEVGYVPKECATLADAMLLMQEMHFQRIRSKLSFACPNSTFLVGIADPERLLAPGTVHLSLSYPLVDKRTGEVCDSLSGKDVLLARHPTIRNSDMQKVRCVCLPELAYLKNTIVMSTRGQIPLAAKLQGGDYDGDKFWICGDERLVKPFMNAPVLEQRGLNDLGIKQETQNLGDIVDELDIGTDKSVEDWFRAVLPFACQEKQLGAVTNYMYELAYHRGLSDPGVQLVADLHDLIIDADKNGYVFNKGDFAAFRRDHRDICWDTSKMQKPAYRENIDSVKFDNTGCKQKSLRSVICPTGKLRYKNVLDVVVFEVLNPRIYEHLDSIHQNYVKPAQDLISDEDLQFVLQDVPPEVMELEAKKLNEQLNKAFAMWSRMWSSRRVTSRPQSDYEKLWQECVNYYNSIRPVNDDRYWKVRHGRDAPDTWECVKVGVLASRQHYGQKKNFMLWVATDTVHHLKASSPNGKKTINRIKAVKKPKAPRDWAQLGTSYGLTDPNSGDDDMYLQDLDDEELHALEQLD